MLVIYAILAAIYGRQPMYAVSFPGEIPDPVFLQEDFLLNDNLASATKRGGLFGAESIVEVDKNLYTGLNDGKIVKIAPLDGEIGAGVVTEVAFSYVLGIPTTTGKEESFGRPLGIRHKNGLLFIADGIYGIYFVNATTGQKTVLVQTTDVSPPLKFPNDLVLTSDGSALYFTDTSAKFDKDNLPYILLEGTCDGRILKYDLATGVVTVILDGLCAPNGLDFNQDESRLVFSEFSLNRVRIVDTTTWDTIKIVYFSTYTDNVRLTNKGTFLIGGSVFMNFDKILTRRQPVLRQWLASAYTNEQLLGMFDLSFNGVFEMDQDGNVLNALYDQKGSSTYALSQATQLSDGRLVLGSFLGNHISFIDY